MPLKRKVEIFFFIGFMALLAACVFFSKLVVIPGFRHLQDDFAIKNIERCLNAVDSETEYVSAAVFDWANWSDTYEFVSNKNPQYIESNLDDLFPMPGFDLLIILNTQNEVVWGKCYNSQAEELIDLTACVENYMSQSFVEFDPNFKLSQLKGVANTEVGNMCLVSSPILKSDGSGPANGTLIMGKILDKTAIDKIAKQVDIGFEFINILDLMTDSEELKAYKYLTANNEETIVKSDNNKNIYSIINDITGRSDILVKANIDDSIMAKGLQVNSILIFSFFIAFWIFTVLIYIAVDRTILRRISVLQDDISQITKTGDLSLRTRLVKNDSSNHKKDELLYLGQNFNSMLQKIENMEDKLKHASQAKADFLANMSHEIRTPMNAIIGFSELLYNEDMNTDHKTYISTIRDAGQNLLTLVNDILDFSKIEAGKMQTEIADCDLGKLLGHIDSLMRPLAIKRNIDFQILQCTKLPSVIQSDFTRLCQCLINLTNNAIKFTEQGYVYINVSYDKDASMITFDVEDSGIGIVLEKLDSIFESFTQADGSTTRKYGGTGLGLTITKKLSKLLGGDVTVKSQVGKGTVFSLTVSTGELSDDCQCLDKYKYVNNLSTKTKTSKENIFKVRVLVAEDNKSNQMLIRLLLEKHGAYVNIVNDGIEAVKVASEDDFDIILMDMIMPKMTGYEAAKKLKSNGIETPIVALTANAFKDEEIKCRQAGCDDFLPKPIEREKLTKLLNKYFGKQDKTSESKNAELFDDLFASPNSTNPV